MAKKPLASDCAEAAMKLLDGPELPYVLGGESLTPGKGVDCQGLIEAIVRQLGGTLNTRGSNDMIRNFCSKVVPVKNAPLQPGCVLFIVKHDGNEPDRYKGDSMGNSTHVAWYTGGRHEVVHASASNGKVVPSTVKNGFTHAGWLSCLNYDQTHSNLPNEGGLPTMKAIVIADSGSSVRMRKFPSTTAIAIANVPLGTVVDVAGSEFEENGAIWTPIKYGSMDGFMMSSFLKPTGENVPEDSVVPRTLEERLADIEKRVALLEARN